MDEDRCDARTAAQTRRAEALDNQVSMNSFVEAIVVTASDPATGAEVKASVPEGSELPTEKNLLSVSLRLL